MTLAWYDDDIFLRHDTGKLHPERPARLKAVRRALESSGLAARMQKAAPPVATVDQIAAVHDREYIQRVEKACAADAPDRHLDPDTPISADSYSAALYASGAMVHACDEVMSGKIQRAFCTVRPPGHHAERSKAMGFCLFNHVAVGAEHLIGKHNLKRIAIVDFDVHHGNGTQHSFEERSDVLFISIHEHPIYLYPGTGFAEETGKGAGVGYTLNVPMMPGAGDAEYKKEYEAKILPRLHDYKPEMLLISAGFDAAKDDPLAHIELSDDAFHWMTRRLVEVAVQHCKGRIVSTLEGGYDLPALGRCAAAHVRALLA